MVTPTNLEPDKLVVKSFGVIETICESEFYALALDEEACPT